MRGRLELLAGVGQTKGMQLSDVGARNDLRRGPGEYRRRGSDRRLAAVILKPGEDRGTWLARAVNRAGVRWLRHALARKGVVTIVALVPAAARGSLSSSA